MTKFIELTYKGQKFSVNVGYIIRVMRTTNGATMHFNGDGCYSVFVVEESYEEVTALIKELK